MAEQAAAAPTEPDIATKPDAAGRHASPTLLRFLTCGSVDDGKSTLIGRMLYEQDFILDDQFAALERDSRRHGTDGDNIDYALLVDGLQSEREQGITIDVAYRYFSTPKRSFVVADTPGHEQYTRNMATGASNAELAVILVDARKGLLPQTLRHSIIVSLLGIRHVVLAVNKLDLVGFDQAVFDAIASDFRKFTERLTIESLQAIPISARHGDNVSSRGARTPWYRGPHLFEYLETVDVGSSRVTLPFRMAVQWVNRPNNPTDAKLHDFRGLSGQIASGIVRKGQQVAVLPGCIKTTIKDIWTYDGSLDEAFCPQSVTICLEHDIDISRGDMIVGLDLLPGMESELRARTCWMHTRALSAGKKYFLKHTTHTVQAVAYDAAKNVTRSTVVTVYK